jgi:hypothetical protein
MILPIMAHASLPVAQASLIIKPQTKGNSLQEPPKAQTKLSKSGSVIPRLSLNVVGPLAHTGQLTPTTAEVVPDLKAQFWHSSLAYVILNGHPDECPEGQTLVTVDVQDNHLMPQGASAQIFNGTTLLLSFSKDTEPSSFKQCLENGTILELK